MAPDSSSFFTGSSVVLLGFSGTFQTHVRTNTRKVKEGRLKERKKTENKNERTNGSISVRKDRGVKNEGKKESRVKRGNLERRIEVTVRLRRKGGTKERERGRS